MSGASGFAALDSWYVLIEAVARCPWCKAKLGYQFAADGNSDKPCVFCGKPLKATWEVDEPDTVAWSLSLERGPCPDPWHLPTATHPPDLPRCCPECGEQFTDTLTLDMFPETK